MAWEELRGILTTAALTLITSAAIAIAKLLLDLRREARDVSNLLLGYKGAGGGLLTRFEEWTKNREKLQSDVDVAFARIRELERELAHSEGRKE